MIINIKLNYVNYPFIGMQHSTYTHGLFAINDKR